MELPKNITQIGEVGKTTKVYAEDYVVSYLKQLNGQAGMKQTAAALYGTRKTENGVTYYFIYGACKLDMLTAEVRHLSQAQLQEIERLRVKFFPEQEFLGYRILNGEMIEGFHIREQEICRYLPGYAQFYEKNDSMLAYMLSARDEAAPEQFDQSKYEEVKKRQDERRAASESGGRVRRRDSSPRAPKKANVRAMQTAVACVFVLLCLLGLVSLQDGASADELAATAGETWTRIVQGETLTVDSRLDEALLEENQTESAEPETAESAEPEIIESTEPLTAESAEPETIESTEPEPEITGTMATESSEPAVEESAAEAELAESDAVPAEETTEETTAEVSAPAALAYVICGGDTLSAISLRQYGTENRVTEICDYNGITNPDDIKEGQVIMLPQ